MSKVYPYVGGPLDGFGIEERAKPSFLTIEEAPNSSTNHLYEFVSKTHNEARYEYRGMIIAPEEAEPFAKLMADLEAGRLVPKGSYPAAAPGRLAKYVGLLETAVDLMLEDTAVRLIQLAIAERQRELEQPSVESCIVPKDAMEAFRAKVQPQAQEVE